MAKLVLSDLMLLVAVVWANRDGQNDYTVRKGFDASSRRLVRKGYLERNPTAKFVVRPTELGVERVWKLVSELDR